MIFSMTNITNLHVSSYSVQKKNGLHRNTSMLEMDKAVKHTRIIKTKMVSFQSCVTNNNMYVQSKLGLASLNLIKFAQKFTSVWI